MNDGVDISGQQDMHRAGTRLAALTVPTELQATSLSGRGREIQLADLTRPTSLDAVARNLRMTSRTLRRRLRDEDTPFRKLLRELRLQMAMRCIRDSDMSIEEIASAVGFGAPPTFGMPSAAGRWQHGGFCRAPVRRVVRNDTIHCINPKERSS